MDAAHRDIIRVETCVCLAQMPNRQFQKSATAPTDGTHQVIFALRAKTTLRSSSLRVDPALLGITLKVTIAFRIEAYPTITQERI